jgi:DNA-directed RNA polymerase specialized sigma24 family protein
LIRVAVQEFCRVEGKVTTWTHQGTERHDGPPERAPRYWRCRTCGRVRLQLADVTDADAFVLTALDEWEQIHGRLKGRFDRENFIADVTLQLWKSYLRWDGRGTFRGYGMFILRNRITSLVRTQIDTPSKRPEDVTFRFVGALSLDALTDEGTGLEFALGSGAVDDLTDSDPSLARALAERRRALAREDRRLGCRPPARAAPGDPVAA